MAAKPKSSRHRKPRKASIETTLRSQQRAEISALKERQRSTAKELKRQQKISRVRLQNIHKAQRKQSNQQRRDFRHRAAILKKKGLIRPEIDIRNMKPGSYIRGLFSKYAKILEGKETTFKVPKEKRAELKAKGYTVVNGRVVLSKNMFSRQGKVFTHKARGMKSSRLETIKLGRNFEKQIAEAFADLGPNEFIGFQIEGANSFNLYQVPEAFAEDLKGYKNMFESKGIKNLTIFRTDNPVAYQQRRAEETRERDARRNKRANERRKEKRGMKAGMRVSRGR